MSHNICEINRVYSYSTDVSCIIRASSSSLRKHYSCDEYSQKILIYFRSDSSLRRILWRSTRHMNQQRSFWAIQKDSRAKKDSLHTEDREDEAFAIDDEIHWWSKRSWSYESRDERFKSRVCWKWRISLKTISRRKESRLHASFNFQSHLNVINIFRENKSWYSLSLLTRDDSFEQRDQSESARVRKILSNDLSVYTIQHSRDHVYDLSIYHSMYALVF